MRRNRLRPFVQVVRDDDLRELDRPSLNRFPNAADWVPGGALSDVLRGLNQPICIHRKAWEYALCVTGLRQLGVLGPQARGLGVGAGTEPVLYLFANEVAHVVATDLYESPDHEGTPDMLERPADFAPFPYREDRLEVLRMGGDDLAFEDGSFDFVFCLSSLEHFGSRDVQRRSLDEMIRVLRPDGVACIITELILTGHEHHEYFTWEQLDEMFLHHPHARLVGGEPDLRISQSHVDYPVHMGRTQNQNASPHIVLDLDGMLWTSFSMFLQKLALPHQVGPATGTSSSER